MPSTHSRDQPCHRVSHRRQGAERGEAQDLRQTSLPWDRLMERAIGEPPEDPEPPIQDPLTLLFSGIRNFWSS